MSQSDRMPFGKQFSPNQVDLPDLLRLAKSHEGDEGAFKDAIRKRFWVKKGRSDLDSSKLATNTFWAMRDYGLLAGSGAYAMTEVGNLLVGLVGSPGEMYRAFGLHILTERFGMQLVEVARARTARGQALTAPAIAAGIQALDIDPGGRSGEKLNPMRLWLERAGVFVAGANWKIDEQGLERVLGVTGDELEVLAALPAEQRAFLRALVSCTGVPPIDSAGIRDLAELQTDGIRFNHKMLPKEVLEPLADAGWLQWTKKTGGRGGKAHQVAPTAALAAKVGLPLANALADQAHLEDPADLRRPFSDLLGLARSKTASNHERGQALEGLCLQIVRLLGAQFVDWRLRSNQSAGAEVDVLAEFRGGRYQLLQIQSKASPISGREVVDREVGVSRALRSNILLFVTARRVGNAPRAAAAKYMQRTNLAILFLDGDDLDRIKEGHELRSAIVREFENVRLVRRGKP